MAAKQETARALLGAAPYHHGLSDENRPAVRVLIDQTFDAVITKRQILVGEYFSDYLQVSLKG